MPTCKHPKAMAKSLRGSLAARSVSLSHSECLEIVAKQFGFADWNTLSAKFDVDSDPIASPQPSKPDEAGQASPPEQLSCSFCGKSQHQVRSLIEGGCGNRGTSPCVFICDECVAFSAQINADTLSDAASSQNQPTGAKQ